jgi:hypothetical protein
MKINEQKLTIQIKYTIALILGYISFTSGQPSPNPYFPLEIGDRWDYFVEYHVHGGYFSYDTLSIKVISKELLPNGIEYFVYSDIYPLWPFSQTKYVRYEDSCVYFYKVEDSTDCLAFRFDLPDISTYYDCNGQDIRVYFLTSFIWDIVPEDTIQLQPPIEFAKSFGIINCFRGGIIEISYELHGCIISGKVFGHLLTSSDEQQHVIHKFSLDQNYPNPFNPSTTIAYSIPQQSLVTLKVYDLLGGEVATLVNEEKQTGIYEIEFDGSNLPSGVYFYQLRVSALQSKDGKANGFVETKKMILMR